VTQVTTDPGAIFGEPTISQDFAYYEPVYDEQSRSFRGFREVLALGPVVDGIRSGVRSFYHTSDALRGRAYQSVVSSITVDPGAPDDPNLWNWTTLSERFTDYATADGTSDTATLVYGDGSAPGVLGDLDDTLTPAAFANFTALMNGSADAAEAFLAFPVQTTRKVYEGEATPAVSVNRARFDVYGNAAETHALGDLGDPDDDIARLTQYLHADTTNHYLTNLPYAWNVFGHAGDLPTGTTIARSGEIFYDGADPAADPAGQSPARGNPTTTVRNWTDATGSPTRVHRDSAFDEYGNTTRTFSAAEAEQTPSAFTETTYDTGSRTFPIEIREGSMTASDPETGPDFVTTLDYGDSFATTACPGPLPPPGLGLACAVTDPNGQVTTHRFDAFGRTTESTGPNGTASAVLYHDADRGTANQRIEVRVRWDVTGDPDPAADPGAITQVSYYDGLGRTLRETRPGRGADIATRHIGYDAAGRVAQVSRWDYGGGAVHPTQFTYDALGRTIAETLPDGTVRSTAFAPREVSILNVVDGTVVHQRSERSDAHGRLAEIDEYPEPDDPGAGVFTTRYHFDPFGGLARVENAVANDGGLCGTNAACPGQQHVTEILYDELGNRLQLDEPNAGVSTFTYDARGLMTRSEDARGMVQVLSYDALGRLVRQHTENPELAEADAVFSYGVVGGAPNSAGRLVRAADAAGYEEFGYDDAGNPTSHRRLIYGRVFDFARTYDPLGRELTTQYPDGETTTRHYDGPHLARISTTGGAFTGDYVPDITWDALDRPLNLALGGSTGDPVLTKAYGYDPVSSRLAQLEARIDGTPVATGNYTIDGAGRITAAAWASQPIGGGALESAGTHLLGYDGLDRLVSATPTAGATPRTWEYDALGNLTRKDYAAAGDLGLSALRYEDPVRPNALTFATSDDGTRTLAYRYDAAGNVVRKTRTGDHGAPGAGAEIVSFAYDASGQIRRTRSSSGLVTNHHFSALGQRLGITQKRPLADANADVVVGIYDLRPLLREFGSADGGHADFDGDTRVGFPDLQLLMQQFGSAFDQASVFTPEPGFEYQPELGRANKHIFVAGVRVASSATTWTAPAPAAVPTLAWRWAWWGSGSWALRCGRGHMAGAPPCRCAWAPLARCCSSRPPSWLRPAASARRP